MDNKTRIFCNDLCVLDVLYPNGINHDAEIITDSPNIHFKMKATSTNDRIKPARLVKLTHDIHNLCIDLYQLFKENGYEYDSYSVMYAITCQQNFLKSAMVAQDEDFKNKVIIVQVKGSENNLRYTNHFSTIFKNHTNKEIKIVDLKDVKIVDPYSFINESKSNKIIEFSKAFASNFPIYPLETTLWPFLKRFWPAAKFLNRSGVALIEDNQMIRSACTKLSLRGYSFEFIKEKFAAYYSENKLKHTEYANNRFNEIENIISPILKDFIVRTVSDEAFNAVYNYLLEKIRDAHIQYSMSYKCSQNFIDAEMQNKKAVLSNMLKNPIEYGFATSCRENNIKLYAFQHGICREISPHFDFIPQITESNMPHFFITNTKKAAEVSLGYPFTKAKTIPVGITKDHYSGSGYIKRNDFPDIFYISTNVYIGNSGFLKSGGDDVLACKSEIHTIRNILAKLNCKVLYKTYPTQKYLDADPCINEVQNHENIIIYKENKDLRYISKYARILVTSKATSTFNWCFLTNKPLIFFDHPDLAPLRKDLIPIYKDMLFYFDLTEPNIEQKIIKLLNKPTKVIEKLYNSSSKKHARNKFINDYYFTPDKHAEKRVFDIVKKALSA